MGGVASTGRDNDELIDNLIDAGFMNSPSIERVFRAIDRADYFLEEERENAYRDSAWKSGNIHISAPCIYSEVMVRLSLAPGLSFLNLGSGTGYLSTMAGLILGPYGINDGIEIHQDVVRYANKKLEEFQQYSAALDEYEFCPPRFINGNCLSLSHNFPEYDRVYCGAACPSIYENYMKHLIKVGGILVIPIDDKLMQIKRTSETTWDEINILSVSFSSLITPDSDTVNLLPFQPLTLQSICRSSIRTILRKNINNENPDIFNIARTNLKRPKRKRRLFVPIFEESDLDNSEDLMNLLNEMESNLDAEISGDMDRTGNSNDENNCSNCQRFDKSSSVASSFIHSGEKFCFVDHNNTGSEMMEAEQQSVIAARYMSPYTTFMQDKIQDLPLPEMLKHYLNLNREFH